jgi:hypothetical protein
MRPLSFPEQSNLIKGVTMTHIFSSYESRDAFFEALCRRLTEMEAHGTTTTLDGLQYWSDEIAKLYCHHLDGSGDIDAFSLDTAIVFNDHYKVVETFAIVYTYTLDKYIWFSI